MELKEKLEIEEQKKKVEEAELLAISAKESSPKNIDVVSKKLGWTTFHSLKTRYIRRFKSHKTIVCNFELLNGNHTTVMLPIDEGKIVYKDGCYVVDDALKYYHMGIKEWCLDYHEGFSLPIKRKLPIDDINKAMQQLNTGNIAYATNPNTLRTFQVNDVVRSAIQAAGITEFFKQVRLLVIVAAIASVLGLLILANEQGYFSGIM